MTLPSSGALSLSAIQTEFGGSNPISINEYYAGGSYVPSGTTGTNGAVPSSGQISFSQFYGTSDYLDTQVVNVGITTVGDPIFDTFYGYDLSLGFGTITDGTSNIYGGAQITSLNWSLNGNQLVLTISGSQTNSGWTTMTVNGTNFSRASASYSSGSPTSWIWSSVSANPFTSQGTNTTITWT